MLIVIKVLNVIAFKERCSDNLFKMLKNHENLSVDIETKYDVKFCEQLTTLKVPHFT